MPDYQIADIIKPRRSLYPRESDGLSLIELLMKVDEAVDPAVKASGQKSYLGRKQRPFDFEAVTKFQTANVHHSTCIHTKVAATVGLGFETPEERAKREAEHKMIEEANSALSPVPPAKGTPKKPEVKKAGGENVFLTQAKTDEVLDPLCDQSFQDLLNDVCEDFFQVGNGYMEVVREGEGENSPIVGLFHLSAMDAYVYLEDEEFNKHYEITSREGGTTLHFADFGDLSEFRTRFQGGGLSGGSTDVRSEVIQFRRPTSLSRWYGFPDWLAATQSIELVQMLLQQKYDFFLNRGVPEYMLFLLGKKLSDEDWEKVTNSLKAHIGLGNSHKSMALNLNDPEMKVQLEKLAMENKGDDGFAASKENLALDIVSAHRVPPLLAGIQIPGKLGATNELPNAIQAFHLFVAGPAQRLFKQRLSQTLGNSELNGGLGLTPDDFNFRTIINQIDIGQTDTIARMRQTLPEAKAEGRDLNEGLKD